MCASIRAALAGWVVLAAAAWPGGAMLRAETIYTYVHDTFSDGVRTKTGALDTHWYRIISTHTLDVVNDPTLGMAMRWADITAWQGITGDVLPSITLAETGDYIQLAADFRFLALPGNQDSGFRFGLYNRAGTPTIEDNNASVIDDFGYYVNFSTGANKLHSLWRESGGASTITSGTDRAQIGSNQTTLAGIADTNAHSLLMRLTRTDTGLNILVQLDGTTYFNETTTGTVYYTFDEIAFGSAGGTASRVFTNVVVTSNVVPEPSSLALLLLAAAAVACRVGRRPRP
jgi:hypothetical protein